ncbi:MAG: UDP-N-acetylmuramoyl-tripeptide-D-alanyl-D-alanine ligase [Microgenomates group bacterium GW2011_GWF2_45_18]|nr:MAG: UDP-N-acetylmuramoyl-tripeptide-D-alanyl-D-alanine ligase [Microgenomates group bacterium GW2011_GWF1_44_10]KKU02241.1 MAG: UDP-N-acetylmuramoyl-tripeptide-D-alanyl-D-alanine ligase [Microgenomates group bacterium GW2011_GWF2_45_18]HAU98830.1 hypothetical protein [Candidatus Paceibacterota bacterium]HAX01825.1 hypothetical protein [Candidatus Paceibacterota bacterium]
MSTLGLFYVFSFFRVLYWLGLFQTKEYRIDRVFAHLAQESLRSFWYFFPSFEKLQSNQWKRPRMTLKVCVLFCIWTALHYVFFSIITPHIFLLPIIVFFIPISLFISLLPLLWIQWSFVEILLLLARKKIGNTHIIGITGSYGKTSTKQLLAHVLSKKYSVFTTPHSYNTAFSIAREVIRSFHSQQIAILEYAAYTTGEIARIASYLKPSTVIVTAFAPQHLGLFGSREAIIHAKRELVLNIKTNGVVYRNEDSEDTAKIVSGAEHIQTYSANEFPFDWAQNQDGYLDLSYHHHIFHTKILGSQYLSQLAVVWKIAQRQQITEQEFLKQLESFRPTQYWPSRKINARGATIIDAGRTSNPTGFSASIQLASFLDTPKKCLVFGGIVDMGNEHKSIHARLGEEASKIFDEVWYCGEVGREIFTVAYRMQNPSLKLISNSAEIREAFKKADKSTGILIEGFLPKIYESYLQ